MTITTTDRIRAVALAQTPKERRARFYEVVEIAAQTGGILLDSDLTTELVILGELLGIAVEWARVELPIFSKPDKCEESASGKKEARGVKKVPAKNKWEVQQTTMSILTEPESRK